MKLPIIAFSLMLIGVGCAGAPSQAPTTTAAVPPTQPSVSPPRSSVTPPPGVLSDEERTGKRIRIATEKGDIVFELFGAEAPIAVTNFLWLTTQGFYDGLTFHRVEPGFVIQGGDPNGNGTGGPGYRFADEPVTRDYDAGIVAMANAGPNTNGSQFFIMLEDNPSLPKNYTIFGKVISGMEVVRQIKVGDRMASVTVEDAT
jgi:cyclophilin family peptidyl-prolyl cis-trans isomerase